MGKISDSLLGGTSGRTGRIVVANVYGNEITRIRPKKMSKKPTAKQELIQSRMRECATFIESYKAYACKHYGVRIGMKSCYNLAMTNLMANFDLDYVAQTITPNYPSLSFSKGGLLAAMPLTLASPSASAVELTWQNNSMNNPERATDLAQILVAVDGEITSMFLENTAERSEEAYVANLPATLSGKEVHVWLAFRDVDQIKVSNSVYMGSITLM